jgi:putative multicomponent Na+:H+ antiporter subunit B
MTIPIDPYVYVLVALLPLAALMLIFQTNPYHALALRGILGAVAAMVYGVLGAADVALTEALVGTLLAITLYAIAVRSSLVLRLGVLETDLPSPQDKDLLTLGDRPSPTQPPSIRSCKPCAKPCASIKCG